MNFTVTEAMNGFIIEDNDGTKAVLTFERKPQIQAHEPKEESEHVSAHVGDDGKDIEQTVNSVFSIVEKDGSQYIRVRALGEDFCLGIKLAEDGKEMTWQEAIDYCKERKRDLLTKRQYHIVAIFHDEINKMLKDLGGDKLGYDWSVSEYGNNRAWIYYGNTGTLYGNYKCNSSQVRPSLAHFSNL